MQTRPWEGRFWSCDRKVRDLILKCGRLQIEAMSPFLNLVDVTHAMHGLAVILSTDALAFVNAGYIRHCDMRRVGGGGHAHRRPSRPIAKTLSPATLEESSPRTHKRIKESVVLGPHLLILGVNVFVIYLKLSGRPKQLNINKYAAANMVRYRPYRPVFTV